MIDLDKHGISYLKFKPISSWNDDDFAKLFNAIASEHAAPVVDLPFIAENIEALLSVSSCRQCGNCCNAGINCHFSNNSSGTVPQGPRYWT